MTKKRQNVLVALLIIYSIAIIYCMFFGFNRVQGIDTYRFQLVPNKWPLMFPGILSIWIFDLGNIVAFIPFGILIPKLLNIDFKKFVFLFIIAIFSLEILQSITGLGAFDIDDIISNTLGTTIGYIVYKKAFSSKLNIRSFVISAIIVVISIISTMIISESGTQIFKKTPGEIESISEFEEINKELPQVKEFDNLIVLEEEIKPILNLYSGKDNYKEFIYKFEDMKDVILYANFCIEDGPNLNGRATIHVNGDVAYDTNSTTSGMESIELPFDRISEVKIKVSGDAKLWDVGVSKLKHWGQ
jgi:glycopeptide antibiotics resistance protein